MLRSILIIKKLPAKNPVSLTPQKTLDDISSAARIINRFYHDNNSVYKNPSDKRYYLTISKNKTSSKDFNKVCNILSEYGNKEAAFDNYTGFFSEHCECIVKEHAIHILSRL